MPPCNEGENNQIIGPNCLRRDEYFTHCTPRRRKPGTKRIKLNRFPTLFAYDATQFACEFSLTDELFLNFSVDPEI